MSAVEEFELAEPDDDGGTPPPRTGRRRASQPLPWILTALALVGIGAANSGPVPISYGAGSGPDIGLFDLDIRTEPSTVWTTELRFPEVVLAEGDRAVVVEDDDGAGRSVLGLDLANGAEVWRYYDRGYTCTWGTSIGCVDSPGSPGAVLVLIDISDGSRHTRLYPRAVAVVATEDDAVVIQASEAPSESVALIEADGSERWRVELDVVEGTTAPFWTQLAVVNDRVEIYNTASSIEIATGAVSPITRWTLHDDVDVEIGSAASPELVVHTPVGRVPLQRDEILIPYDDDLGGAVALSQDPTGRLIATLRADGTELWRMPSSHEGCRPVARLQGALVTPCWGETAERVVGWDLRTGNELWSLSAPTFALAATRDNILMLNYVEGTLFALDPLDGSQDWTAPLRVDDASNLVALSNGVLLSTHTSVVRLLWDR